MPVSPSRAIAYDVLARVEREGAYAADALHARLGAIAARADSPRPRRLPSQKGPAPEFANVKRQDAALATELVFGVLRWQRLLDFFIERQSKRPADSLDAEVRLSVRLGAYQILFLDRIPLSAAVNESVELVKRARKSSAAGFVNAILRRIPRGPLRPAEIAPLLPKGLSEAGRLGILFSHPAWMVARWLKTFGRDRTRSLLEADNRPPALACAALDPGQTQSIAASLREDGLEAGPGNLLKSALILRGGNPADTAAFREGWIAIQDEASQAVALLLGVEKNRSVLDLCAAPGNKTLHLARAAGPRARFVAADIHAHRLRAVKSQLRRTATAGVSLIALDAERPLPFSCRFDRVFVDAPCSGTGTLARNPEIRWRLRPEDIPGLAARQGRILRHALESLAPGGRLVYATCSMEAEENEQVVRAAIAQAEGIRIGDPPDSFAAQLAPGVSAARLFDRSGFFRTGPGPENDGFFAAILEKS